MVVNDRTRLIAGSGFLTSFKRGRTDFFPMYSGKSVRPLFIFYIKQWVIVVLVVLTRVFGAYCAKWRNSGSKTGPVAE